ncbi:MAG: hypothetical protein CO094_02720 [Anaerolineae bacterium CG_4_9_14_3_um_filter_57_17]|nr:nucleotidyltransferase domain-containing protein [bacterium]NCT21015.1 nucleotidyltransferase domain-containing protein [bacterium]OIO83300.1 MAG: hypothetical protein AUK01_12730 [Anaerolineae bacterium CG2_30_57_67]PJB67839.1 MAG: hypothetical protein CO094_02720 [Anaerolineae bacterium CG_4_9_14_3_um_filter_57_17]
MIDLSFDHLEIVKDILRRCAPHCEVRAFGSRVAGKAKPYSDLDLVLVSTEKLSFKQVSLLRTAFEESKLPFRVDVLDWQTLSPTFRQIVLQKYEVLQGKDKFAETVEVR